jgi:hypothetical protein
MPESRQSKAVIAMVDDAPSEPIACIGPSARGRWLVRDWRRRGTNCARRIGLIA